MAAGKPGQLHSGTRNFPSCIMLFLQNQDFKDLTKVTFLKNSERILVLDPHKIPQLMDSCNHELI